MAVVMTGSPKYFGQSSKPLFEVIITEDVFCNRNFPTFAKFFPQAPVGNFVSQVGA